MNTNTNAFNLASDLAKAAHCGQKYGDHDYYDYHVCGVVASLMYHSATTESLIVGFLHDVVEDSQVDLERLSLLFGEEIAEAVDAITKREGETRCQYILRCKQNPIAREVKSHDAMFNALECFKQGKMKDYQYYLNTLKLLGLEDKVFHG